MPILYLSWVWLLFLSTFYLKILFCFEIRFERIIYRNTTYNTTTVIWDTLLLLKIHEFMLSPHPPLECWVNWFMLLQAGIEGGGGGAGKCPSNLRGAWEKALSDSISHQNSSFLYKEAKSNSLRESSSLSDVTYDLLPSTPSIMTHIDWSPFSFQHYIF